MKFDKVTLRCDDGAEAVVFSKYSFMSRYCSLDGYGIKDEVNYEICIEDDYVGGDYKGFFGRLKRAWRAFWDKPVVYTGIYCENENKMRKFLCDCLDLIDKDEVDKIKNSYKDLNGNK